MLEDLKRLLVAGIGT